MDEIYVHGNGRVRTANPREVLLYSRQIGDYPTGDLKVAAGVRFVPIQHKPTEEVKIPVKVIKSEVPKD